MSKQTKEAITSFNFEPGNVLARKYMVQKKLGSGWEGEVYLLKEKTTGIERAAKFFFPHRNIKNKALNFYAKKLHKLRECPALIQYHTQEMIRIKGDEVSFLVSEYVEGEILHEFVKSQPGSKLDPFQGMHLLYGLSKAIEGVHNLRDYHGDLHSGNVIIKRKGLSFDIKLLDFFHWGDHPTGQNIKDDVVDVIKIFYDAIGGKKTYAKHSKEIKSIILGQKRSLILKKFKSITILRKHLEDIEWSSTLIT